LKLSNTLSALIETWTREAAQARERFGLASHAHLILTHVEDLEAAISETNDELLSLTDAGSETGYSASHLGRLVKAGTLTNHGTQSRPKVRRGDLPMKRSSQGLREVETSLNLCSTRTQIARAVVTAK
jgi:hypothetical protein